MALVRKAAPDDPAVDNTDYTDLVVLQATDLLQANGPHNYIDLVNDLVLEGAVFNVGGTIYLADSDTAISGTPSPYVEIIPSGATATAAYAADLTGVSWDGAYNGWYDGSGNLHIFDEAAALAAGAISELHQKSPLMTPDGGVAYKGLGDVGKLILLKSYAFDEAGTDTLSVPAGSITLEAIMLSGGGGGGGAEDGSGSAGGKGGGGGAAGNFRAVRVPCFRVSTISYVVGAGGARGTAVGGSSGANGSNGSNGGDTSITVDSITYAATGGLGGGGGGIGGAVGVGGAAGSYVESDIDIAIVNGKAGQNGVTNTGGFAGPGGIGGALLNSGSAGGGAEVSTTASSLGMYINYAGGAGGVINIGNNGGNGSPGEIGCGGGGGGGGATDRSGGNGANGGRGMLIIKFYGIPQ